MAKPAHDYSERRPLVTFGMDLKGRCTFCVGPERQALGPRPGEPVGRHVFDTDTDPGGLPTRERVLAGESLAVRRTVEGRLLETFFEPVHGTDGSLEGVVAVSRDVAEGAAPALSDLRASMARLQALNAHLLPFRALVETSSDFIAIAGLDGAVRYLNPAGRALVEMDPDIDVTTTAIQDYLTAEGIEASERVEQPAVVEHGRWEGESTLRRADGASIPVEISSFLMHHPETGEPFALATVQRDITERLAAVRAQEEFITLVAHELRTPLSSVKGYVEIASVALEQRADPAVLAAHLRVAARNIDRMERQVEQILRVAGERRPRPDRRRPADLLRVVEQAVESARPQVERAGLDFRLVTGPPLTVAFDESFAEVVENLVSNATKYTPAGGRVVVTVAREEDSAVLSVVDTGPGVPRAERDSIFEKFARGDLVARRAVPGLGLGLFITRAIVLSHDGEITVEDHPGGGARFVVRLPLSRNGRRSGVVPPVGLEPPPLETPTRTNRR